MSQRLSPWRKRAMPRWSILPRPVGISAEQTELSPVSIAGLPLSNATVWVGPPVRPKTARVQHRISVEDGAAIVGDRRTSGLTDQRVRRCDRAQNIVTVAGATRVLGLFPISVVLVTRLVAPALAIPPPELEPRLPNPVSARLEVTVSPVSETPPLLMYRPPPAASPPAALVLVATPKQSLLDPPFA